MNQHTSIVNVDTNERSHILHDAAQFVYNLLNKDLSSDFVYHNYQHTVETVERCKILAEAEKNIPPDNIECLLLAAWFHDTGYIYDASNHEEKSKEIAKNFLQQREYPEPKINQILECIDSTRKGHIPETAISRIISDANVADTGMETYPTKAVLLRYELSKTGTVFSSEKEWIHAQLSFLQTTHFYTEEGKHLYEKQLCKNSETLRDMLYKIKKKEKKKREKNNDPNHGIQTMFRSIYRNHINLSSIADNKANMMIRVNSIIISITLTLVGAKFSFLGTSFKHNQIIIYPIITLLLTGLCTIIFAILSARPNITHRMHNSRDIKDKSASILFFGNYSELNLAEFKSGMRDLFKNKDDIYETMITDLYYLGKILTRKYYLITISYLIFLNGLIITALVTAFVVLHLKNNAPADININQIIEGFI